ncbi:hypothetical protein FSP39_008353 [Pinctada imbricata]|uniref:CCHC-type domain-containing protein n=1 Tax=Pinctada imbricata TaxID=66713 RepID=A0AA89C282_PINIB|nr:hypothetical protein FSP39_008353 [Pinctada imbricata]
MKTQFLFFSTSLNNALERQKATIGNAISEQFAKSSEAVESSRHVGEQVPFDFKHEGHKIQHSFNQERIEKLSEIEALIKGGEISSALTILSDQKVALQQRNKIIKVADRHGWDTVHEYLDDPLADDSTDAAKLRYAVGRAARKRSQRSRPYDKRRGNPFSANDFFRGFGRSYGTQGFPRPMQFQGGMTFGPRFNASNMQFPQNQSCFYCKQSSHFIRDCPFIKARPIPTMCSSTGGSSGTKQ